MNRAYHYHTNRGAAMVEFALVAPLLVMFVFGITELGRAMYQLNTISKAAESGARYLARANDAVDVIYDEDTGLPDFCSAGAGWAGATAAVTNLITYGNEGGGGTPLLPGIEVEFDPMPHVETLAQDGDATAGCVVSVVVSADFVSVFGGEALIPFTNIQPIRLSESVQERFIGE